MQYRIATSKIAHLGKHNRIQLLYPFALYYYTDFYTFCPYIFGRFIIILEIYAIIHYVYANKIAGIAPRLNYK